MLCKSAFYKLENKKIYTVSLIVQVLASALWLFLLRKTDSYYSVYCVIAVCSVLSFYPYVFGEKKTENRVYLVMISFLISVCICLSNYKLFLSTSIIITVLVFCLGLAVGLLVCYNAGWLILFIRSEISKGKSILSFNGLTDKRMFWSSFVILTFVYSFFLFTVFFPGNLSPDSISQIKQVITGYYSNHHPFWHTVLIKAFYDLGLSLFHNPNSGVAIYNLFQLVFIASVYSGVVLTVYQYSNSTLYSLITIGFYAFVYYHIAYSCTMWKDIVFSAAVTLFILSLFRIVKKIGNKNINMVILLFATILFGIWRSNGKIALLIVFLVSVIAFFVNKKNSVPAIIITGIIISFVLTGPVLNLLNVKPVRFVESLSIPIQQISRVIYEDGDLDENDINLINKVIDINTVSELYDPIISDPVKFSINDEKSMFIEKHKQEYFKLWLHIGINNPKLFVAAWIDQTKGYWNAGYDYWRIIDYIYENDYGIVKQEKVGIVTRLSSILFRLLSKICNLPVMIIVQSIGCFTWLNVFVLVYFIIKRRIEYIITIPNIALIMTLLIATPVYSEFRYVYYLFTTAPIILGLFLFDKSIKIKEQSL